MRTAMIAAMSCALLTTFSTSAFQCPRGQALATLGAAKSVSRPSVGEGPNHSATAVEITLNGTSEIDLPELVSSHRIQSLELVVGYQTRDPVSRMFSYLAQGKSGSCAYFGSYHAQSLDQKGILRVDGVQGNGPELCFDGTNKVTGRLTVEMNTLAVPLGQAMKAEDFSIQVLADAADGDVVGLIDTDGAVCNR